jgi:hypothetical protein
MIFWLMAIGLVILAWKTNAVSSVGTMGASLSRLIGFDPSRLSNPGANEEQDILMVAAGTGVDPRLLSAIRMQENGGPGKQYGILGLGAATLSQQLQYAANTIRNTLKRYSNDTGQDPTDGNGRYTPDFLSYLANGGPSYPGWAPVGASNDPNNFNQNWLPNVSDFYYSTDVVA